ncbi:hypothetical protein [Nostoc sp. MG11]|uniref:hypothetical protein n=1 Tax=Nostoc sp. MG11 TaxID=2721166 RepID=UPI0018663AD3|nr:hypothetical protein [Nostoc sp. MG11]
MDAWGDHNNFKIASQQLSNQLPLGNVFSRCVTAYSSFATFAPIYIYFGTIISDSTLENIDEIADYLSNKLRE